MLLEDEMGGHVLSPNHIHNIHMIAEPEDPESLTRGMKDLKVRMAPAPSRRRVRRPVPRQPAQAALPERSRYVDPTTLGP